MAETLQFKADIESHFEVLAEDYDSIDSVSEKELKIKQYRRQVEALDKRVSRGHNQARQVIHFKFDSFVTKKKILLLVVMLTFIFFNTYLLLDLRPFTAKWMLLAVFFIIGVVECL